MPLETEVIAANPRVAENAGKVAIQRGPIVFCAEASDQPSGAVLADTSIALNSKSTFKPEYKADLLGGIVVLHHEGTVSETPSAERALYMPVSQLATKTRTTELTLIPYYAWANRQPTAMAVWIPYQRT